MTITAADVARTDDRPLWVEIVEETGEVWWDESRPHEGGRRCVVRRLPDGAVSDLLPPGFNARNRLVEYGGRSWRRHPRGLVFTNWSDGRLYLVPPSGVPVPFSEPGRYGDLVIHGDEVICVREIDDHRAIVAVPLDGSPVRVLTESHHFLMNPRMSPDGTRLAWIGWNHPDMPWDATELCVSGDEGWTVVATGAVAQAEWRDDATLYAVTDVTGWWNLHTVDVATGDLTNLTPLDQEFAEAVWKPGITFFAPLDGDRVVTLHGTGDGRRLSVLSGGELRDLSGDATYFAPALSASGTSVVAVAGSPYRPYEVVLIDTATGARTVLSPPRPLPSPALLPTPASMTVEGVHVHLYAPRTSGVAPYVVFVHGGPTGSAPPVFDLEIAYFTSRGIGVAEVNYGGSTGYGRAYRERLRHNWGVVDVQDSATVARWLVSSGRADRVAIRGGSAGGWTALAALVHTDAFIGAVAHYAITDPESWANETHDFESRYLDGLIGPLPRTRRRYLDRSPLLHAAKASGPSLLLHGLEDAIVDVAQARRFVEVAPDSSLVTFEGEQHGWRRESTIIRVLELELDFYHRLFDLA